MASKAKKHVAEQKRQSKPEAIVIADEWAQWGRYADEIKTRRTKDGTVPGEEQAVELLIGMKRGCEDRIMAVDKKLTQDELEIKAQILGFSVIPNERGERDTARVCRFAFQMCGDIRRFLGREA